MPSEGYVNKAQIEQIVSQLKINGERIIDLESRVDAAHDRADAADARADAADARADVAEQRADQMQADSLVDREMIAELQADGLLSRENVEQLQKALVSSRVIGTAVGLLMSSRGLSQEEAVTVLKQASQRANRKMSDLAADLVDQRAE